MSLETKGRLVDMSEVDLRPAQKEITKKWVKFYKSIPEGKVFITTDKELGVGHVSVRTKLDDYQRKGWVSKSLRISYRHRKDGNYDIFIIHDKESKGKESKGGVE